MSALTDYHGLADALLRHVITIPWHEPQIMTDTPPVEPDILGRIREVELRQEEQDDALADAVARLDALGQQHAALVARVMGLSLRCQQCEGDHR